MNPKERELFEKYLAGECSKEEARMVLRWLQTQEGKRALQAQMDDDLAGIEEQISQNKLVPEHPHSQRTDVRATALYPVKRQNYWQYYGKIAAAISVLIISSYILFFALQQLPDNPKQDKAADQQVEWVEKVNPPGQKMTLVLPDGSTARLNAASSLRFRKGFASDRREIYLDGEGFFEVKHDTARPFTVHAGEMAVTALGTSFNVNNYPEKSGPSVALETGKVAVKAQLHNNEKTTDNLVYLLPGEKADLNIKQAQLTKGIYEPQDLEWRNGTIAFRDASFAEVVAELERWYGVEFDCNEKVKRNWKYTGTFQKESLEEVLTVIGFVRKFSFEINGKKVMIR